MLFRQRAISFHFKISVLFIMAMAIKMSFMLPRNQKDISQECEPIKREILLQKLGRAYNPHFMAMDSKDLAAKTADQPEPLPEDALDESRYGSANESVQEKRSSSTRPGAWTCQIKSKWIDMGRSYFPRYYKTVTCSSNDCWYGHFRCRAREFQFQIMKRKPGATCKRKKISLLPNATNTGPSFDAIWELHDVSTNLYCKCTN
ncbi:protein trunk-like [Actinia tenebrosa]|uniref:Protein trunk-like n=1 Tax=Actinia tenebrosa TaxID=6105 RepID=A0A6P8I428_ACTTE|nr:protein trunk-like [Actinia tenebrosa]